MEPGATEIQQRSGGRDCLGMLGWRRQENALGSDVREAVRELARGRG